MNKSITFTQDSIRLVDGEIYLTTTEGIYIDSTVMDAEGDIGKIGACDDNHNVQVVFPDGGYSLHCVDEKCNRHNEKLRVVVATTNTSIPNVKKIDRSLFVKPDVDVEELADKEAKHTYTNKDLIEIASIWFKSGYNANKKEFTREEMEQAMSYSTAFPKRPHEEILNMFRPLSIPTSVICDEEYNIIEVK